MQPLPCPDDPFPPLDLLEGASLFVDFDGTLVGIAPRPDDVAVDPPLRDLMDRLWQRLDGRLAVISGRSAAQIDALFGMARLSIGGSHGLELRWPDGRRTAPDRPAALDKAADRMRLLAGRWPGVIIEEKPLGVALHYRGAPGAEDDCRALALALAKDGILSLQAGKMVFELRAGGAHKGDALRAFMTEPALTGTRPVFIGDDITDEDAFAAAAELGGAGILVGPPRATAALYRLDSVEATRAWLNAAAEARP